MFRSFMLIVTLLLLLLLLHAQNAEAGVSLTVTPTSTTSVYLSWTADRYDLPFEIRRYQNEDQQLVGPPQGSYGITSFTVSGLTSGAFYEFIVDYYTDHYVSSGRVGVTMPLPGRTITLTGSATSNSTVYLSWIAVQWTENGVITDTSDYYTAYEAGLNEPFQRIGNTVIGGGNYTATGFNPGSKIQFKLVSFLHSAVESNIISVHLPGGCSVTMGTTLITSFNIDGHTLDENSPEKIHFQVYMDAYVYSIDLQLSQTVVIDQAQCLSQVPEFASKSLTCTPGGIVKDAQTSAIVPDVLELCSYSYQVRQCVVTPDSTLRLVPYTGGSYSGHGYLYGGQDNIIFPGPSGTSIQISASAIECFSGYKSFTGNRTYTCSSSNELTVTDDTNRVLASSEYNQICSATPPGQPTLPPCPAVTQTEPGCMFTAESALRLAFYNTNLYTSSWYYPGGSFGSCRSVTIRQGVSIQVSADASECFDGYHTSFSGTRTFSCDSNTVLTVTDDSNRLLQPSEYNKMCIVDPPPTRPLGSSCTYTVVGSPTSLSYWYETPRYINATVHVSKYDLHAQEILDTTLHTGDTVEIHPDNGESLILTNIAQCPLPYARAYDWKFVFCYRKGPFEINFPLCVTCGDSAFSTSDLALTEACKPCAYNMIDTNNGKTVSVQSSRSVDFVCQCVSPQIMINGACYCPLGQRYINGGCTRSCNYYIFDQRTGESTDVKTTLLSEWPQLTERHVCRNDLISGTYVWSQIGTIHSFAAEFRCNPGTKLDVATATCVPEECSIRMSSVTPRIVVMYSNGTGYVVANEAGRKVLPIPIGLTATVTNFCPTDGGPFKNENYILSLNCKPTGGVRVLQIPACVNKCPRFQSWNGQECVCDESTKDFCHTCGPLGNCNTRGTCQVAYNGVVNNTFCSSCSDNYAGDYCENEPEVRRCTTKGDMKACDLDYEYAQCDCGAKWIAKESPSPTLPFRVQSSIGLYTSYYDMDRQIELPPRPAGSDPVKIENQNSKTLIAAKYACYNDPDCDGITWLPYSKRFTPFKLFSDPSLKWETPGWIPPTGLDSTYEIYRIDRHSLYNCANFEPDYYWYYFHSGYRYEIETEYVGQNGCIDGNICGHSLVEPLSNVWPSTAKWYAYAVKHWKTIGHKRRYSPNPTCILSPTLYDTNSRCAVARSGCEQTQKDALPCGGHGYCVQSSVSWRDPKPYKCDCKMFSESDEVYGDFALMPKYMGYACQYETATFCTTPGKINVTNFCNGHEERCQPSQVSDNIPLASKIKDYIPACNCGEFQNVFKPTEIVPASQFTGAFCNVSLCGDPKNCNYMDDGKSKCVNVNAGRTNLTSKWQCSCGWTATGDVCQQSSAACVNPAQTDAQDVCTGKGVCMPSGLPSNLYANNADFPNYQSNSAWCSCKDGHVGKYCWDVGCTLDELVPGHGICNNEGSNGGCFNSWRGPSCNISKCTETGGTNLRDYSGCDCPHSSGLTTNRKADNGTDYSCWPRCPDTGDSISGICGNTVINTCALDKTGPTSKTAVCQCNKDKGWIEYTVNDPVLGNVKSCKPFCSPNGVIAPGWSPTTNPIPCICNATSGMISNAQNPRCDVSKCEPNGVWDGNRCVCNSPLYYGDTCQLTYCNNNATDVNEGHPDSGTSTFCECNRGYTHSNSNKRDCDAPICGKWGDLNANYQVNRPLQELCTCKGIFRTAPCTNADCTPYCASSLCEYGGSPYTVGTTFPTLCMCPFPFKNLTAGGYCSLLNCANSQRTKDGRCDTHYCGENGKVTIDLKCECGKYWKSSSLINTTSAGNGACTKQPCCDISPCQNGGIWNQTSSKCTCPAGNKYAGDLCETLMTTVIINAPTSPPPVPIVCGSHGTSIANVFCSCKDYWSGTTCTISPCGTHGTFNATSLGCNCAANYVGTFCETFIPPATVPPPTTTPPPSTGASPKMFDIDMLSLFIFVLIVVVIV